MFARWVFVKQQIITSFGFAFYRTSEIETAQNINKREELLATSELMENLVFLVVTRNWRDNIPGQSSRGKRGGGSWQARQGPPQKQFSQRWWWWTPPQGRNWHSTPYSAAHPLTLLPQQPPPAWPQRNHYHPDMASCWICYWTHFFLSGPPWSLEWEIRMCLCLCTAPNVTCSYGYSNLTNFAGCCTFGASLLLMSKNQTLVVKGEIRVRLCLCTAPSVISTYRCPINLGSITLGAS